MSFIPRLNKVYKDVTFTNDEIRRYGRHLIMPEVTLEGQQKLKAARVIVIGTGGLGAPILAYLAAAGVGHIGVVDFDTVDISNLHRQIIHKTGNVGKLKTQSAVELMKEINPLIDIKTYDTSLRSDNALDLLKDYDIVIDGTDNFPTRYLVNDACALLDKPNVYGSIFRFEGQATVFWASQGPCYRCLYPEPPEAGTVPSCAEGGVLGVLPGVMGTIQATEAVKLIIGAGRSAHRAAVAFRCAEDEVQGAQVAQGPEVSALRDEQDDHGTDRLRVFLRRGPGTEESRAYRKKSTSRTSTRRSRRVKFPLRSTCSISGSRSRRRSRRFRTRSRSRWRNSASGCTNSIARGKFGFIVRMEPAAARRGNCFTMPDSGRSKMSQVESMLGAKTLTPIRRGIEDGLLLVSPSDRRPAVDGYHLN